MDPAHAAALAALQGHSLFQHCMAVYNGKEDIETLMQFCRFVLGWWADQIRPVVQLCQPI